VFVKYFLKVLFNWKYIYIRIIKKILRENQIDIF